MSERGIWDLRLPFNAVKEGERRFASAQNEASPVLAAPSPRTRSTYSNRVCPVATLLTLLGHGVNKWQSGSPQGNFPDGFL